MAFPSSIRQLYHPVQPTVRQSADGVSYREIAPHPDLQQLIYCYWQLSTEKPLSEPFSYRVVADGCIDIFFELSDPADNYVMGFCRKYTEFPLGNTFHYVGIRFLPTMFPQLFRTDASELSNRYERLELVAPETAAFIRDHFDLRSTTEELQNKLDGYFLRLVSQTDFDNDPRLYKAIALILEKCGLIDIGDLDTGISERQLRRLFEFYVGDSAKTFSKVVRFQNILKAKPSTQSLRRNKLFFDSGYYDQAHFIKEFKTFYGVTPGKAFGR